MRNQLRNITAALTSVLALAMTVQLVQSQEWPTNGLNPVPSVPQYSPRYPLNPPDPVVSSTTEPNARPVQLPSTPPQLSLPSLPIQTPAQTPAQTPVQTPVVAKPKIAPHFGVDYSINRDTNLYPIDPRKPCNQCVRPGQGTRCIGCGGRLPGQNGKPYMEEEPGGCTCQKRNPTHHPQFSLHWPRPMSARLDERFAAQAAQRYSNCQPKKRVDMFDHLSTFKLSGYLRTDNGDSGRGADPYGCLGESKQRSNVVGVGYRFPSEPVERGLNQVDSFGW